jgi:hypothetical protein
MQIKMDDLELIKRVEENGVVVELRSVRNVSISGRRRIVELRIPGAEKNVFQDLGREPLTISFEGELVGSGAKETLEELREKFELREPVKFVSDITPISDVEFVVIEDFAIRYIAGEASMYWYRIVLKEYRASPGPGSTKPPSQDEDARRKVRESVKSILKEVSSGS